MKVGDLVKPADNRLKSMNKTIGVVVSSGENLVRVCWANEYGTFWTRKDLLENISQRGNNEEQSPT
jgi:hypothetical protein